MANRRRRLSWYIIWTIIFFFFFAALFSVVISLPVWKIDRIMVLGNDIVSKGHIEKLSEGLIAKNIFLADYSALSDKLRGIYQIRDFGIFRKLPSTVIIKLVERKPFAVVVISGTSAVIDEEGFILRAEGAKTSKDAYSIIRIEDISKLPTVRINASASDALFEKGKPFSNKLTAGLSKTIKISINDLSRSLLASDLQFEIDKQGNLDLLVEDILRVRFGNTSDIAQKIAVLEALLPVVANKWRDVDYIDIRVVADPVIRYKKPKNT